MLGSLLKDGVEITNDPAQADCMIVNTCSFIDSAQEESVDTILESAEVREASHRGQGLIVSGCLSQRFRDELPTLFPEVDAFMGIDQVAQVGDIVKTAMARRAEKIADPSKAVRAKKKKVVAKLAELDKGHAADEHAGVSCRASGGAGVRCDGAGGGRARSLADSGVRRRPPRRAGRAAPNPTGAAACHRQRAALHRSRRHGDGGRDAR